MKSEISVNMEENGKGVGRALNSILLWMAGADQTILDDCGPMVRHETRKLAAQGSLVLIPAAFAAGSMTYVASTLCGSLPLSAAIGLIFGLIVLSIDRYIVSTLHKAQRGVRDLVRSYDRVDEKVSWKRLSRRMPLLPLISRVTFTVVLGVVVSDPIVLLINSGTINAQLNATKTAGVTSLLKGADVQKANFVKSSGLQSASAALAAEEARSQCLGTLLSDEQSGVIAKLSCGSSSGIVSQGPNYQSDLVRKNRVDNVIIPLLQQRVALLKDSVNQQSAAIDKRTTSQINQFLATFSNDYPARLEALQKVANVHPSIYILEVFLFLFFFSIDLTALFLKLSTPAGTYEVVLDSKNEEAIVNALVTKERRMAALKSKAVSDAQIAALAAEMEMTSLIKAVRVIAQSQMDASEIILKNSTNARDRETISSLVRLGSTAAEAILNAGTRLVSTSNNTPE